MPGLARRQAGATSALLVVLASERLDLAPSGYGWLLGAIGIGAVLGPYALTRLVTDPRRPAYVFGPYVLRGTVDLVLATFTALPVALLALAAYGWEHLPARSPSPRCCRATPVPRFEDGSSPAST